MTVRSERQSSLGRGLSSLIPQRSQHAPTSEIPIERIRPNPRQPRQRLDQGELDKAAGILQSVMDKTKDEQLALVARLRAA